MQASTDQDRLPLKACDFAGLGVFAVRGQPVPGANLGLWMLFDFGFGFFVIIYWNQDRVCNDTEPLMENFIEGSGSGML